MFIRDKIYDGLHKALAHQMYSSAASGRPRILSILSGSLLGVSQVLPAENIMHNAERFKFDIVEPSINRFSGYVANRHVSSTPTLRTTTLGMIDLRLAIAHNPIALKSPIETLSWLTAKYDVPLFKDSVLDIFRKLNISPFDIELRHLFKAFAEADGNIYQTTMNGIQAYCRRNYTRINGTQVPLPSITEEELTLIAAGYLGILIAYILPMPVTPVDNYQLYWATNILPQVFGIVDQFNERNIIDTKHIEAVAKAIYLTRYKTIHQPDDIAHTLVYIALNSKTTPYPATLLEHMGDDLRDQIADDTREILKGALETERDRFGDLEISYTPGFVDLAELDEEICKSIENDLDKLYYLQENYVYSAMHESNVLALENLHARYYHLMKPVNDISLEDIRNMTPAKRGTYSVSAEGVGLVVVGVIAAAVAAVVAILAKVFGFFKGAEKANKDINENILRNKEGIDKDFDTLKSSDANSVDNVADKLKEAEAKGAKLIDENFKKTRRIANILMRYNKSVKIPQGGSNIDLLRAVGNLIKTKDVLQATMLTRKDNSHAPQIPAVMFDRKAMDIYSQQSNTLTNSLSEGVILIANLLDRSFLERHLKNETFVHDIERSKFFKNKDAAMEQAKAVLEQLSVTGPVNAPEVLELTYIDKLKLGLAGSGQSNTEKHIASLKRSETEAVKVIEELVSKGLVSEEYAAKASKALKAAIKHTSDTAIVVAKCYKHQLAAIKTINTFVSEFRAVTSFRVLFESPELEKALQRIVSVDEYDQDRDGSDSYIRIEI
jgi:hypothetical protein